MKYPYVTVPRLLYEILAADKNEAREYANNLKILK